MSSTRHVPLSISARLLEVLGDYDRVLIVMHDNPDPDAIASAWGLEVLIREKLEMPVQIVAGGAIVRAENRHMVELLEPPIELVNRVAVEPRTAPVLVDCGADSTNHLLQQQGIAPVAIIDHHTNGTPPSGAAFSDIRPQVAASATIAASYLREQHIHPGPKLSTAMLYAIRTETCGYETYHSPLDRKILPWLTERGEPSMLAEIENAPLSREYFGDLLLGLQSTFLYDGVGLCFLPRAEGAEIVGEIADMLIRCESIRRVLCAAVVGEDLLLSARTQRGFGSAVRLLQQTLDGLGGAGGHAHRAGGKIPAVGRGSRVIDDLHDQLRDRWLAACGVPRRRGTRLIPKREIVEHLDG